MAVNANWIAIKEKKEEFVANLNGGSHLEILLLCITMTLIPLTYSCIKNTLFLKLTKYHYINLILESAILSILAIPLLTDSISSIYMFLIQMLIFGSYAIFNYNGFNLNLDYIEDFNSKKSRCIQNYRSVLMLITCITILAVDFNIFPRRFAKTETFGTGFMDIGTGVFIFEHGLMKSNLIYTKSNSMEFKKKLSLIIKRVMPLLLIAIFKIISNKLIDYQIHVGEYGVHWNFFLTLAVIELLRIIINDRNKLFLIMISVTTIYQYYLKNGLIEYLHSNERTNNIIDMNKEGIFSIIGYYVISLSGTLYGNLLRSSFSNITNNKKENYLKNSANKKLIYKMLLFSVISYIIFIMSTVMIQSASRRACNISYILWVISTNSIILLTSILSYCYTMSTKMNISINAIENTSDHMLLIFLVANLLTGITNMLINTLNTSNNMAFIYLCTYSSSLFWIVDTICYATSHLNIQI